MFSFQKVIQYTNSISTIEIAKSYYDKCFDGLKELGKVSNRISQFIFALMILTLFSKYFNVIKINGNEIDIKLVKVLAPTVLSYLILEWLMIAKRRRDYIFALQQLSYKLYSITPSKDDEIFPGIDPNSLNVMPYSFMCELITIAKVGRLNLWVRRLTIITLFVLLTLTLIVAFHSYWIESNMSLHIILPSNWEIVVDTIIFYACFLISIQVLFWIAYHYYNEFKNLREVKSYSKSQAS